MTKSGLSEYRFNLEIFKINGNKEVKISNIPIEKLNLIVKDLLEKYG